MAVSATWDTLSPVASWLFLSPPKALHHSERFQRLVNKDQQRRITRTTTITEKLQRSREADNSKINKNKKSKEKQNPPPPPFPTTTLDFLYPNSISGSVGAKQSSADLGRNTGSRYIFPWDPELQRGFPGFCGRDFTTIQVFGCHS